MMTRFQKYAERHLSLASMCVEFAKDCNREHCPTTAGYYIARAQAHMAMVRSYGF